MRSGTKLRGHGKSRQVRGNPRLREKIHDTYRDRAKRKGPARCTECGATYVRGLWRWRGLTPPARPKTVCPACRRVRDRYPAGELTVGGTFLVGRSGEIERLIRNTADSEAREHPLHRIMSLERVKGTLLVTTTDVHLPHRIGHALKDAWGGTLTTHYDDEGYFARVVWQRDD